MEKSSSVHSVQVVIFPARRVRGRSDFQRGDGPQKGTGQGGAPGRERVNVWGPHSSNFTMGHK